MKTNAKNIKLICMALAMLMILGAYAAARGTVGMVGKNSPSVQPMSVVSWTISTGRPSSTKAEIIGSHSISQSKLCYYKNISAIQIRRQLV